VCDCGTPEGAVGGGSSLWSHLDDEGPPSLTGLEPGKPKGSLGSSNRILAVSSCLLLRPILLLLGPDLEVSIDNARVVLFSLLLRGVSMGGAHSIRKLHDRIFSVY
jgi:hypothetical protein